MYHHVYGTIHARERQNGIRTETTGGLTMNNIVLYKNLFHTRTTTDCWSEQATPVHLACVLPSGGGQCLVSCGGRSSRRG